jgi:hypothetical protein
MFVHIKQPTTLTGAIPLNEQVRMVTANLARTPAAAPETFADKLRKAVKTRATKTQQHNEHVERERNRRRPFLQRRERSKGDREGTAFQKLASQNGFRHADSF